MGEAGWRDNFPSPERPRKKRGTVPLHAHENFGVKRYMAFATILLLRSQNPFSRDYPGWW
jgi:hypothetical protein